jgi:diguanylate cyclase (GGDEF)-like protein/PAS domain S-box-containing protein
LHYPSDLVLQVSPPPEFSLKSIRGAGFGVAVLDSAGAILQANPAFCDFLGYPSRELVGLTIDALTHPADRDRTGQTFQSLQASADSAHTYEKRYLRKDGSIAWSITTVHCLAGDSPDQKPTFIGFIQDLNPQKDIGEKLRAAKGMYEALVENIGVGLSLVDRDHRILMVNSTLGQMLGREPGEFVGRYCFREFENRSEICAHCPAVRAMESGKPQSVITVGVKGDGSPIKVRIKTFPVFDAGGVANGFIELIEDLSGQLKMETALQESEDRFRSIFEKSGVGMKVLGRDGQIIDANPAFCNFVGYSLEELKTLNVASLTRSGKYGQAEGVLHSFLKNGSQVTFQECFLHKDRRTVWGEITGVWVPGGGDGQGFGVGIVQDITKKKEAQARLEYLDYHDELTGLPNQKLLKDRLSHAIAKAKRGHGLLGVMLIGLDRFTKIISSFDHQTGDLVLRRIADRLQETVRQADTLARFGDTEFVILLEDVEKLKTTRVVARNILQRIAEPISIQGHSLHITASLGIGLFPGDGEDAEHLLRSASAAMNRAKQLGGDLFEYFIPQLNVRTRELIRLEVDLRKALKKEEFVLHFQPQIDLRSRAIAGFEVLVRWQHPERGLVQPGDFIPTAEETGVIVPIGEWILRQACLRNMAWLTAGLTPVSIAVNISPRQFRRVDLPALVRRILDETGHPPELLELEITESMVMDDVGRAIEIMKELAAMGVHLAIDDFGSGYSSLLYLKRFPVQRLKVDRNFVKDIMTDANDAAIAGAVVALAKAMHLEVVAEGIETEEQLAFFLEKGCEFCQGYLFSKPLDAAMATDFLARYGLAPITF